MPKHSNKEKALAALLETNSIRDAAKASGLSEATIYRFLADKAFLSDYRAARRQTVESAISKLQSASNEAVSTLIRNMNCANPAVETRTAQIVYENAIKGVETMDILERLEWLENEYQKQVEKT
ncbi:MAG: helix-turn-helix domain-containing protein [Pyrinomonadaceae bacterium]